MTVVTECVFCEIMAGRAPGDIVYADDLTSIKIARAVDRAFPNEGMTLWHSIGPASFQEVPHMHMHVHPRRLGDGLLRVYPGAPVDADPTTRASYAERLRHVLADELA
jgi:histidine triad (HIT) family protein